MDAVTVHEFLVPDFREDDYVPARGKASREVIEALHGLVVEGTAEVVAASLLNESGRYHRHRDLVS